jgi:transposase
MGNHSEAFVGLDTSKLRNAVAIADGGRSGEVRFFGEIENTGAATAKLVRKLATKYGRLTFCYEAGPTGYGLYRQIKSLGHECLVVAPSLIPKKSGDHVKTNRRDAIHLARQLRADELTAVWVPDRRHEAMRDLTRARETAMMDLRSKRQQVSAFLLRQGLHYAEGRKTWTKAHQDWLARQKFEHPEQRLVFEEMMLAVRQAQERLERLEQAIRNAVPDWSLAEVVTALMAMRGMDLVSAATFLAEVGDLSRFQKADGLMAYLGLVPSEDSTGDTVKRGPITKAGNRRARRMLVECSWSYQHPPRVGADKQHKVAAAPPAVRAIAWKAQCRLHGRYRTLMRRGKLKTVVRRSRGNSPASSGRSVARSPPPVSRPGKAGRAKEQAKRSNLFRGACTGARSGDDKSRATAGAKSRQGEFLASPLRPIARSTPDRRPGQPQTKRRTCVNPRMRAC